MLSFSSRMKLNVIMCCVGWIQWVLSCRLSSQQWSCVIWPGRAPGSQKFCGCQMFGTQNRPRRAVVILVSPCFLAFKIQNTVTVFSMWYLEETNEKLLCWVRFQWAWATICSNAAVSAPAGSWGRLGACLLSYRAGLLWILVFSRGQLAVWRGCCLHRHYFLKFTSEKPKQTEVWNYTSQFPSVFSQQHVEQPLSHAYCALENCFLWFFFFSVQ